MKGYNENKDFITLEAWKKCREVRKFFNSKDLFDNGVELIESAKVTLNGYINYIRKKIKHK
ncbi:MAG: hypothetical protein U9R23_05345 [Candidatus Cloacimonadota bacterium]|nr:hypothetical protein [Candidatus Cloacimonadota bacterium]